MNSLIISIFGNQIFSEIMKELKFFSKYNIKFYDDLSLLTNNNKNNLKSVAKKEEGGLSGEPLQQISTNMIKIFYKQLGGRIPIIGVGGVSSGKSAYEKIIAGASLLQLYTGFVYKGPSVAKNIKKELIQILKTEGIKNINEAVGAGI